MPETSPNTILNVSHHNYMVGGSDRVFLELGTLLESKGHTVVPFCSSSPLNRQSEYEHYFPPSINTTSATLKGVINYIYSLPAKKGMGRLLNDIDIDLAHLHIYYGQLTSSILQPLRSRGIPIVQTLHDYKIICPVYTLTSAGKHCESCVGGHFWRALPKSCNRGSVLRTGLSVVESYVSAWSGAIRSIDHFIGISEFITQKMISSGIPENRITTIHNFINTDNYKPDYSIGEYVVYFGRIETVKGIYTLLEACRDLPDTRLVIAGTGGESENVARWIANKGLHNIDLVGFLQGEELHKLLRRAICTIVPSEWEEPFGLTIVESLALGIPVVATTMGGIPELINNGEDGLLVPPKSPIALRDAIEYFAKNPQRAAEMGRSGRAKVAQNFDKDRYYESVLDVYRKAQQRMIS